MRRLAVFLAFVVLLPNSSVLLAGCGSPAPTEQDAAPTNTAVVLNGPTVSPTYTAEPAATNVTVESTEASPAISDVADRSPTNATMPLHETPTSAPDLEIPSNTPTARPTTGDGIEVMSQDPVDSSARDGGITAEGRDPSKEGGPPEGDVQGRSYTWEDGDRTLTVHLQTDLAVEQGSGGFPGNVVAADNAGDRVVRGVGGQAQDNALPVFRSEYGELMTLPGGVLLILDSEWSETETEAFFSTNSIKRDRVSELSYATNGFFIDTEPGFPSLELANTLAVLDGVEVSSPNWAREEVPK